MVKPSSYRGDKKVFGVVDSVRPNKWITEYTDTRLVVNGLGEGGILVTDADGPIESGDLLWTSEIPGYASRQGSEFVASYTVAKATMDCDFRPRGDVPLLRIKTDPDTGRPVFDDDELVLWEQDGDKTEPAYRAFDLPGGRRGAFISCTYRCS